MLDPLSHRPDLPLWHGSEAMLGLGLWYLVPATLAVKLSMFAIRVAIYVRVAPARDRSGFLAF